MKSLKYIRLEIINIVKTPKSGLLIFKHKKPLKTEKKPFIRGIVIFNFKNVIFTNN